jgi:hypothetical protein
MGQPHRWMARLARMVAVEARALRAPSIVCNCHGSPSKKQRGSCRHLRRCDFDGETEVLKPADQALACLAFAR